MPDVLGPGLRVLFCGINPGLCSAAIGHHFARPATASGRRCTARVHPARCSPRRAGDLLALGLGITNLVARATAGADELPPRSSARRGRLAAKVERLTAARWPCSG